MKKRLPVIILFLIFFVTACENPGGDENGNSRNVPKGKLFIIGGGKRPAPMVEEIIRLAGLDKGGYGVVLPMSSLEPDSAYFYTQKQFAKKGITSIHNFSFIKGGKVPGEKLDSLLNADLIYICGGEQVRFMEAVTGTPIIEAIHQAYLKGAIIAGTSAGAAVMSRKMITGNEFRHPEYTGDFRTIEADNLELVEGLGLLDKSIIDQHFIKRMRNNRLITAAIENPFYTCIGIDESTAIVVDGDSARVTGISQVIVMKSVQEKYKIKDGLLGAKDLKLSVYLPGDTFRID